MESVYLTLATRTISGSVGLSVGNVIFATDLKKRLRPVSGYDVSNKTVSELTNDIRNLVDIQVRHFSNLEYRTGSLADSVSEAAQPASRSDSCVYEELSYTMVKISCFAARVLMHHLT